MIRPILTRLSHLPIRWKLTLWSSAFILFLFMTYNGLQYVVIEKWLVRQDEIKIETNLNQIIGYLQEGNKNSEQDILGSRDFLEKLNEKDQFIRILDQSGNQVLEISNDVPGDWVKPQQVSEVQLKEFYHYGDHLLVIRSPINHSGFKGTVEVVRNLETNDHLRDLILMIMLIAGLGAVLLSALGGMMLARKMLAPVQSLRDTFQKVQHQGLHERATVTNNGDEISELAYIFNKMMDQLEHSFQRQKQFVEDASHELRTPLSILDGHLSVLNRWGKRDPAVLEESLSISQQEVKRLILLVQELLQLSHTEEEREVFIREKVLPYPIVKETAHQFAGLYQDFEFAMDLQPIEMVSVSFNSNHLEQIMLILLDNAVKYSTSVKKVEINGRIQSGRMELIVRDYGIGIPEADIPYVFERFYRVDKARSRERGGNGLGLSIARRLADQYDSHMMIQSEEDSGTSVTLSVPL